MPEAPSLSFRAENLTAVRKGMDLVVNSPSGTAFAARIVEQGMAMAGKAGTSQVKRMTEGERDRRVSQEQLPWDLRHHALFCAYAPVDDPRYTCAVVVEHGIAGSRTAAPVARDILVQVQGIDPSRHAGAAFSDLAKTVFDSTAEAPQWLVAAIIAAPTASIASARGRRSQPSD